MALLEANPHFLIYFDNVRVDEFVKSWSVSLNCNGNIGTANIEFIYLPELAYTAASVKDIKDSESIMRMLGIVDNMTNVKIFIKNIFSSKYQMVFDGNIKGKSSSRAPQGGSLSFTATDYLAWTNRTIAPIVIPYTQSTHPSDKFIWEAQGIDVSKVMDVAQRDIINFKGKRLEEIINTVITQALAANSVYADSRGVAYWDGIWDRMDLMADIDPDVLNKNVLDYVISPNQGSVDTMYVLLNDIFQKLMFEFYQDRDGVIRIKPPFWNEPVLKSHIIDPALILQQSESTDYDKHVSRVVITGGLDENFQSAGDFATKLWTPTGAYLSDGTWETVKKQDGYVYGWNQEGSGTGGAGGDGAGGGLGSSSGGSSEGRISTSGFRFIKGWEGLSPWGAYLSGESFRTVGYGSTEKWNKAQYDKHKPFPCTEQLASEIYADRINNEFGAKVWKAIVKANIQDKITTNMFDAMCSVCYNRGPAFLTESHSPFVLIKKNPLDKAAIRAKWQGYAVTSSGKPLEGLRKRRKAEADMYCDNQYEMRDIIKYNQSGKVDGKVTDNNGNGFMPAGLPKQIGSPNGGLGITPGKAITDDFDKGSLKNGHIYKRTNGSPIVGFGMSQQYTGIKANGVWWPSVEEGITGHIQHLASYYRKSLISSNKCIDPKFGENTKFAKTVRVLGDMYSSSKSYSNNIMAIINKMLGAKLVDTEIAAETRFQYDQIVTAKTKQKIKDYFTKVTQGRVLNLSSNVTKDYFIECYFDKCAEELIFPEVAIAQMCEETNYLAFKGRTVYQQNNYGGIGVYANNTLTTASDWYWLANNARTANVDTEESKAIEYTQISEVVDEHQIFSGARSGTKPKYIIIDAGHGGSDPGASGKLGETTVNECDVNLALERMVTTIINNNSKKEKKGTIAYMSRTDNKDIGSVAQGKRVQKLLSDIEKRGHKASDYCLVSIHCNSSSSTSASGYYCLTDKASGAKSKALASEISDSISRNTDYHWEHNPSPRRKDEHDKSWGVIKEANWPHGGCIVECFFMSNPKDMQLWAKDKFPEDMASGIAIGIMKYMSVAITDTTVNNDFGQTDADDSGESGNWGTANTGQWSGSIFGVDYDFSSVDFSELLKPTHDEMRYGATVRQIEQPLVKFSNTGAYYDMQGEHNSDANEVLKSYAKFYLNMNNSMINTSSATLIGSPWIRPGFNVWLDPAYTDKIYYVNGVTHSGSASGGVSTSLQLVHGRHRTDFLTTGDSRGFGALSADDDNIFTKNEYFKSVKHFGPIVGSSDDFKKEKTNLLEIMTSCKDKGIMQANRSPYAAYYASDYGDAFLKTPTILKVNDAGKEIFTDQEWLDITGRTEVMNSATSKPKPDESGEENSEKTEAAPEGSRSMRATQTENKVIKKGDSGEDVKNIQSWLNVLIGANLKVDSQFGLETEVALKNYQTKNNITPSGVYDLETKNQMFKDANEYNKNKGDGQQGTSNTSFVNNGILKKGKKGAKVKELQGILNGFIDKTIIAGHAKLTVDGSFGSLTDGVVRTYQKNKKINIDGAVGPVTTAEINKDLKNPNSSGSGGSTDSSGSGPTVLPPDPGSGNNGVTNTKPENKDPLDEQSRAKGRVSGVMFTDQYTPEEIQAALNDNYKKNAPGVVKQRMHIIEQGVISARKTAEKMYANNNYNK